MVLGSALMAACANGSSRGAGSASAPPQPSYSQQVGSAPGSHAEAEEAPTSPAPAPAEAVGSGEPSAAPKASRARGADAESQARAADERPGLGTTWGETRSSHVSTEAFVRDDGNRPFAVATLLYNDGDGIRAMARRAGISDFGSGTSAVAGGALTVRLLDSSGRPLPGLNVGGRTHFVGSDGERYTIELQNHTGNRIEAVATVDGLDVIDGRAGSFAKRGYLIAPFSTVEIDGFRQSNDEVAAFRFGSVHSSYAARKGNDRNVGVIGVAFFQEQGSRLPWNDSEVERRNSADPFPGRFATPPPWR